MKHFLQGYGDRGVVGVHLHDVGHHVPPFLCNGVHVGSVLTVDIAGAVLITELDIRVFVPIDAVVAYSCLLDHLYQFRPDGGMAAGILFLASRFQ